MPVFTVGAVFTGTTETPEILAISLEQIKWTGCLLAGISEVPIISLVGINQAIFTNIDSTGLFAFGAFRDRERTISIASVTETKQASSVAVLPEKYESVGGLSYGGRAFKGSTVRQGTYLPLVFEISGDRLHNDMDVVLSVEDLSRNILFSKQVKLGVFDDNITTLSDGRDSISGTITIVPENTRHIAVTNFRELRYNLRLINANVRNYVIEKGTFILEEV